MSKLMLPVLAGFFSIIAVFTLFSFFPAAIGGILLFPLVLTLGGMGGIGIFIPMLYQIIKISKLRKESKYPIVVLALTLLLTVGSIWGGFIVGVLTTHPVFFIISFGAFSLISVMRFLCLTELAKKMKKWTGVALYVFSFFLANTGCVLLGLQLTRLWILPSAGLLAAKIAALCSLVFACIAVCKLVLKTEKMQASEQLSVNIRSMSLSYWLMSTMIEGPIYSIGEKVIDNLSSNSPEHEARLETKNHTLL